ncbi:MAG: hypothetical protein HXX10_00340 [Rhodoplanes sp.]|uniref:hypothetical protein n=1 Tax=Rhodoplanes sp. TaxID=1968906 RepID=UPI0017CA9A9B|nr:hypothetical protein [Rhodoplanes sp.]NVO12464.1 hypothetical protein [Rhodoplanes sp.]
MSGERIGMQKRSRRTAANRPLQDRRVLFVCAVFVAMVAAAALVEQSFDGPIRTLLSTPSPEAEVSHVGTIRLAPDRRGRCPEFRFDNDTGVTVPLGSSDCDPVDQQPPRWGSGGTGRMDSIREGFRRR